MHAETILNSILNSFEENLLGFDSHFESVSPELAPILDELMSAIKYPLECGGKRLRPKICMLLALAVGSNKAFDNALRAARAIELMHTYSLVHDDLPIMDNDDLRRGKPTAHKVYGEAKALLIGDALLTEAFLTISKIQTVHQQHIASLSVQILAQFGGYRGMIGGQWLDITLEHQPQKKTYESIRSMHLLKTGCLIAASAELGTLCGLNEREVSTQSSTQLRELARSAGKELGIAFQLVDDLLDATATTNTLGKTAGKDAHQGKQTAVSVLGIEQTKIEASKHTEEAKQKLATLFDRLPAGDETSESARLAVFEMTKELTSRQF